MNYPNGRKVVQLYQDTDFSSIEHQGGVISFNIMHDDGSYVGFAEINCMANIHNIIVRTGCFCNPGACQRQLGLTNDDVRKHFQVGTFLYSISSNICCMCPLDSSCNTHTMKKIRTFMKFSKFITIYFVFASVYPFQRLATFAAMEMI